MKDLNRTGPTRGFYILGITLALLYTAGTALVLMRFPKADLADSGTPPPRELECPNCNGAVIEPLHDGEQWGFHSPENSVFITYHKDAGWSVLEIGGEEE